MESQLVELCMDSASRSRDSIEKWRRQKRSLERLPSPLADALLRRLHTRRLLYPSLLEVFKSSVEEISLSGDNAVDAEWMAYLGAFRYLRSLNLADCHKVTSSALWAITGMTSLRELDVSRCLKVTDAGIRHILSIPTLEKLCISETRVTADGVTLLASLKNLAVLDLGGLPVTDQALSTLQGLTNLNYLDLWGSRISDKGSSVLQMFPKLSFVNLAWTNVTKLQNLPSLECLNMSNCTIYSLLEGDDNRAPIRKLIVSGATFVNEAEDFGCIEMSFISYLDASNSSLHNFFFLSRLKALEHLDLSSTMIGNDSIELIACIAANLKSINLSSTRVDSLGVGILAGQVPSLEAISLSNSAIDDVAILYISSMPSLKVINLSNTNIKGIIQQSGAEPEYLSLTALQSLDCLEMLNLEQTQIKDAALSPLSSFQQLKHLLIKSASLTDISLFYLSSLAKLTSLSIREAVITDYGLELLKLPTPLKKLDLRGCWLLTENAILALGKSYPQIELRHDLCHLFPSSQIGSTHSSPIQFTSRTSQVNKKNGAVPTAHCYIDQRLKYSRDELLGLQFSSLSLTATTDRDVVRKVQSD